MTGALLLAASIMLLTLHACGESVQEARVMDVARMPGLVAFWDFAHEENGRWTSYFDAKAVDRAFQVALRRIGDAREYGPETA